MGNGEWAARVGSRVDSPQRPLLAHREVLLASIPYMYWCGASCVFVRQAAVGLILPCGKNANAGDWFGPPGLLRMRAGSCAGRVQEIVIEVLY